MEVVEIFLNSIAAILPLVKWACQRSSHHSQALHMGIACESFMANFEPAVKSRIFEIAILKIFTVLYHVKKNFLACRALPLVF